jgi:hypothetical protein
MLLLGAALLLLGSQALAAVSKGPLVTDPDWDHQPSGDDLSRYFPEKAMSRGIAGRSLIACRVAADGYLHKCLVLDEAPVDQNFGDAAVRMAEKRLFHMKPMSLMGRPVAGQVVFIPVYFVPPEATSAPSLDFQPGDNALLLTPDAGGTVKCATAALPAQMCKPHTVAWSEQPAFDEVKAAGPLDGLTQLNCQVQADGRLGDCRVVGLTSPAAVKAAQAIASGLLADPKTQDGTATAGARVVVTLNWKRLAQKMALYDRAVGED